MIHFIKSLLNISSFKHKSIHFIDKPLFFTYNTFKKKEGRMMSNSKIPLYKTIENDLIERINTGYYKKDDLNN